MKTRYFQVSGTGTVKYRFTARHLRYQEIAIRIGFAPLNSETLTLYGSYRYWIFLLKEQVKHIYNGSSTLIESIEKNKKLSLAAKELINSNKLQLAKPVKRKR